jgi:hypothetical protein
MATNEQTNTLRRLVIRVGKGSLMFATTDDQSQVVFEQYPINSTITMAANLREALRTSSILTTYQYQRTLVMVDSPTMMVPTELFREEDKAEVYFHAFTKRTQQTVMHTVLPDLSCVALFSIDKDLLAVLNDYGRQLTIVAAMVPVWHHLYQRSLTGTHKKLYGYFHDRRLEVVNFRKNHFNFCNTFTVNNGNNALYYLLGVWKQLGMEREHDELHLAGDLPDEEGLMNEARHYVKRVFYINPSGEFNRAPVAQISGMPYDLMTLFVKGR